MRSEHEAAILSRTPTVATIVSQPSLRVSAELDRMLCDLNDPKSCFYHEHTRGKASRPTTASLLQDGRLYILGGFGRLLAVVLISDKADDSAVHMRALCVAQDVRENKYGQLLLCHVLDAHPRVELSVWMNGDESSRLLRFYGKHGFRPAYDIGGYRVMRRVADRDA